VFAFLFLLAAAPAASPADPSVDVAQADRVPIPAAIRSMLDAALESGNDGEVSTIVKYARLADPASADQVLQIAQKWRSDRARARDERLREADLFDLWTGRVELGGFITTGNSDTAGVSALVTATREGLRWRHNFRGSVDYQESLGQTTRDRYAVQYEPNYKIDDRAYVYGTAQYESDRFSGYYDRLSTSAGLGYGAIRRPGVNLDVTLGPAYRYTAYTDDNQEGSLAARGSMNLRWQLLPGLTVAQEAAAYIERYNSTVGATSSLKAKLVGPLSAQLSYNLNYESEPPEGSVKTNTIGRASLVYTF
jgi:putative salt-induced outer membrane protein